jgi:hypothetical protein
VFARLQLTREPRLVFSGDAHLLRRSTALDGDRLLVGMRSAVL